MVNTNSVLSSILFSQTIDWNIKQFFSSTSINSSFELKRIGKAITRRKDQMVVEDDKRYKRITIKTNCGGVFVRDEVLGKDIKTKKQYYVKAGQLAVSKIDARNGAFGIVPPEADGAIITGNFWVYDVNPEIANIDYLILLLSSNVFVQAWQDCSNGSGNRLYLQEEKFLNYKIPMPEADVQKDLIRKYNTQLAEAKKDQDSIDNLQYQIEQYILKKLGISFKRSSFNGLIGTTYYKNLTRWDPTYLSNKIIINSNEKMIDMAAVIAHFMVDTSGKRLRINTKEDPDKKFAYIGMEHVEKNTGKVFMQQISGKDILSQTVRVPYDYIIYGKLRPYLNKYWENRSATKNVVCSSEFFVFDTKNINRIYFMEILSSTIIQEQLTPLMREYPNRQIVIATHSPIMAQIANEKELLMLELENGKSTILTDEKIEKIKKLSGTSWDVIGQGMMLRSSRPLVVFEGKTDVMYVKRALEMLKSRVTDYASLNVDFLNANGAGNVKSFIDNLKAFVPDSKKIVVFFDRDNAGKDGVQAITGISKNDGRVAHYQDIVQDNITTSFIPYKDGVTEGDFLIEDYFSWDDTIKAIVEDVIPDRKHPIKMLPNLPDKIKKELEKRINKFEADEFNGFIPLLDKIVELTKEQAV